MTVTTTCRGETSKGAVLIHLGNISGYSPLLLAEQVEERLLLHPPPHPPPYPEEDVDKNHKGSRFVFLAFVPTAGVLLLLTT